VFIHKDITTLIWLS